MSRSTQDRAGTRKKSRNAEDRISNLPEHVISHVLSLMPTKDAVRTSVLSRDWENKWNSVYNVNIDEKVSYKQHKQVFFRKKSTRAIFANFLDRILLLSYDIRSFRLSMTSTLEHDVSRIATWICAILMRNIESLSIHYIHRGFVLPRSLLHNTSLRNLELNLRCTFKIPSWGSFPNLKTLNLSKVEIINDSSTRDTLSLHLPVLETLELDLCKLLNVKMVEINAPFLTTFHRTFPHCFRTTDYSIKILSMRLAEFKFSGDMPEKIILVGQQVVYATLSYIHDLELQVLEDIGIQAQILLNGFSNLKDLNISGYVTQAIAESSVQFSLPVFHQLERLVVSLNYANAKGLLELLYAAPFLKFLKVYVFNISGYDYNMVENVPVCIKDYLEEVELGSFDLHPHKLNLAVFLLENGRSLKEVKFSGFWSWTHKDIILEKLSAFSKVTTVARSSHLY